MKIFGVSLLTFAIVYAAYAAGKNNLLPFIPTP